MPQNYAEFIAAIPDYASDVSSELAAQAPSILNLAENRLQRDIDAQAFNTIFDGNLTSGVYIYNFPSDMVYVNYVAVTYANGSRKILQKKTLEYIFGAYWEDPTDLVTADAQIRYWSWYNSDSFVIAGTPNSALAYQVNYKQKIPPLSVSNPTNWLTDRANDALLAACLIETSLYMKYPELQQQWEPRYAAAVKALNDEYKASERDANQVPTFNADNQSATNNG